MNTNQIIRALEAQGILRELRAEVDAPELAIGPHLVRFTGADGVPGVAAGGELSPRAKIDAIADAVHANPGREKVRVIIGAPVDTELEHAIALLVGAARGVEIELLVDFEARALAAPALEEVGAETLSVLTTAHVAAEPAPKLVGALSTRVAAPAFEWQRDLVSEFWSGCADGLEVCRVRANAEIGVLDVGPSAASTVRRLFGEISKGREGPFDLSRVEIVADVIRGVVLDRVEGRLGNEAREARLEARIVRGEAKVEPAPASRLVPIGTRLPVWWSPEGPPRRAGLVMRSEAAEPWVVEIVAGGGGIEDGFRHAIATVALHRAFVQRSRTVGRWLNAQGLAPERCRAAVVFAKLTSARGRKRLVALEATAARFGVDVVQVRGKP